MQDLSILIVHKDPSRVKAALKRNINWAALNMKIAAIISGGDAALALMRQQPYHIVFSELDIRCTGNASFLSLASAQYLRTLFLPIAAPSAAAQLIPLLRRSNVPDFIDAALDPREIEAALRRAGDLCRRHQLGEAADRLFDLNAFDIPAALKKNIRTNLRTILKDVSDANLNAIAQDVAILFHETLLSHNKNDMDVPRAAAIELIFRVKHTLLNQNLECDEEFIPRDFLQKVQDTLTNDDLEDLCLYYLHRGVHIISPNASGSQVSALVRSALEITRHRYSDPTFTLVSLSEEIGISPNYLSSVFKMETGIRFKKYLNSYRIKQAKELLMDSRYKIYEVANLVGIEDSRYFSQIFRTYTGLKPSEYRNAHFNDLGTPDTDL